MRLYKSMKVRSRYFDLDREKASRLWKVSISLSWSKAEEFDDLLHQAYNVSKIIIRYIFLMLILTRRLPVKIHIHHHGQFLDITGRMGIKVSIETFK